MLNAALDENNIHLQIEHVIVGDNNEQPSTSKLVKRKIVLKTPRSAVNRDRCIFGCKSRKNYVIKNQFRKDFFKKHRFYIADKSVVCEQHSNCDQWETILRKKPRFDYTYEQIESVFDLLSSEVKLNSKKITFAELYKQLGIRDCSIKIWCGLNSEEIEQIYNRLTISNTNIEICGLIAYLIKLRTGHTYQQIAKMFNRSRTNIQRLINNARKALENHFVPINLGFSRIDHDFLVDHTTEMARDLYCSDLNNAVVIWDSTYIFIEKSANYAFQRKTYSGQKKRHLLKPMLAVSPDGFILEVYGLFPANINDASILEYVFDKNKNKLKDIFANGDVFLLDRGFRDAISTVKRKGIKVFMPAFMKKNQTQLGWQDANNTRVVTKIRQVIERVNRRLKEFKLLNSFYVNKSLKYLKTDMRVVSAIINCFYKPIKTDEEDHREIVELIRSRQYKENELVFLKKTKAFKQTFIPIDQCDIQFPRLTLQQLRIICVGNYQIKQAVSYYAEHVKVNGKFYIEISNDFENIKLLAKIISKNSIKEPLLIRARIKSRHMEKTLYNVFILLDTLLNGIDSINGYYCTCKNGQRTVGTCSHVMTLIWSLSYARYNEVKAPAQSHMQVLEE